MKTFTVLVYEDKDDGGYWGECLELGCGSQGETLDEMDANIRESIEAVLAVRIEDGEDVSSIGKAVVADVPAGVRKWEISIALPQPAAA
jgi:predicted RNase H-like HicB family nuclease